MYTIYKDVILRGRYDLSRILKKINKSAEEEVITQKQRVSLCYLILNTQSGALTAKETEILQALREEITEGGETHESAD